MMDCRRLMPVRGDSDPIQRYPPLGGDLATHALIDKGFTRISVLPARWTKRQRVCGRKGIGRR